MLGTVPAAWAMARIGAPDSARRHAGATHPSSAGRQAGPATTAVGPWMIGPGVADGLVVTDTDGTLNGRIDAAVNGDADGPAVCAPAWASDAVPPQPATNAVSETAASSLAYEWNLCISFPP